MTNHGRFQPASPLETPSVTRALRSAVSAAAELARSSVVSSSQYTQCPQCKEFELRLMNATRQLEAAKRDASTKAAEVQKALKEQIDDAAQSSVRLCVVAPTVNVTFGDQVLSYKAPLPRERIKSTLELQVLPNFAKGFIQQKEGVAPDGSPMDDWLREMTVTMQGSIEKHLAKVFRPEQ